MPTFTAPDGTRLAYRRIGDGVPLVCLPGGPMQSSAYLGDLGGLSAYRSLILLDLRGTGASGEPADLTSYRCDRLVDDVEALRLQLGLDRVDLLAHSAGAAVGVLYAARYPARIHRLALVTPSPRVVGVEVTDADRRAVAELRSGESWFPDAFAAFERIWSDHDTEDDWAAITPFSYGRWDATTQAAIDMQSTQRNDAAAAVYYSDGTPTPDATRSALAELSAGVLLVAGEYDVVLPPDCAATYAELFPRADVAVQSGAGHYPWLDDPEQLVQTLVAFLS